MAVKGVFASHNGISGSRKGDFASGLVQTETGGTAPLFALSSGMPSVDATDIVSTWFEENQITGRINVTNNATTGTTFTVDDATVVVAGQIYLVESTGEYVFVDSISGSNATVTRGFGGTTNTSINGSSTPVPIQRITMAVEEGSSKPTAFANVGFPRWNFQQTIRTPWDVTRTARRIQHYTGDVVAHNRRDASITHAVDIERAAMWGKKAVGTLNGRPFYTMDGLQAQITTNVQAQSTNVSWAGDIRPFLQSVYAKNVKGQPNERISFCGNTLLGVLEDIARLDGTIQLQPGATMYGFNIRKLITPFGDISLMTHPLMNESPLWTKDWIVLHPGTVEFRYLSRTSEDRYDRDGTRAGVDADYGIFTTQCTIILRAESCSGYFSGIDTAAASDA